MHSHSQDLREQRVFQLRRNHLAADVLWAMERLSPGHAMYADAIVSYAGEAGKDQEGLTVDMLSNFHRSLYRQHPRFFTWRGACVLPAPDSTAIEPLVLPVADTGGDADGDGASAEGGGGGGGGAPSSSSFASQHSGGGEPGVGTAVEAKWMAGTASQGWYNGVIASVNGDGTYRVRYEDGDIETVRWKHIKIGGRAIPRPPSADQGGCGGGATADAQHVVGSSQRRQRRGGGGAAAGAVGSIDGGGSHGLGRGGSGSGGSVQTVCGSVRVMELCGRLLARALVLGAGFVVDDRLPLFVLEYLATDNTLSLRSLESSLMALESVEPNHASLLRRIATRGVGAVATEMTPPNQPPLILQVCDLYPSGVPCRGCINIDGMTQCDCPRLTDSAVRGWASGGDGPSKITTIKRGAEVADASSADSDPPEPPDLCAVTEGAMIDAVRYVLLGCRRHHLDALRRGFQGIDQAGAERDGSCYDFHEHLSYLTPSEFASYLRGRPLSSATELLELLRFRRPDEVDAPPESVDPVGAEAQAQMCAWMQEIVRDFSVVDLSTFLAFTTGRATLSALRDGDPEREAITCVMYVDTQPPIPGSGWEGTPLNASTCARILYVPWHARLTRQSLEEVVVRGSLRKFELERELLAGGAAVDYE